MKKIVKYEAVDGRQFDNEVDCICYEIKIRKKDIEKENKAIAKLDKIIWEKYGDDQTDTEIPLNLASTYLLHDIEYLLVEAGENTSEQVEKDIHEILASDAYGERFLAKNKAEIEHNVRIRKDFYTALKFRKAEDIVSDLGYSFGRKDLVRLAVLHKSGKCRRKIEDMLTAANFHTECSDFRSRDYDKYTDDLA